MAPSSLLSGFAAEEAYPQALATAEALLLQARREKALPGEDGNQPLVGLALSGGGIRSATFGLGLLQALARKDLLRRVDYVSTVSGGGYIGTFLGGLFQPRTLDENGRARVHERTPSAVRGLLTDLRSAPLSWLRDNGRYLTPGGSGDNLQLGVVTLRNWVALQALLTVCLLTAFLLFHSLQALLFLRWPQRFDPASVWSPILHATPLLVIFWILPAGWAYWLICRPKDQQAEAEGTESKWLPRFAWTPVLTIAVISMLAWHLLLLGGRPFLRDWIPGVLGPRGRFLLVLLGMTSLFALVFMALAWSRVVLSRKAPGQPDAHPTLYPRFWLTEALRLGFLVALVLLALGLVDSAGKWLFQSFPLWWNQHGLGQAPSVKAFSAGITSLAAALSALAVALQKIHGLFNRQQEKPLRLPVKWLLAIGALLLASVILIGLATLSQGILWGWTSPGAAALRTAWTRVLPAALAGALLTWVLGRNLCFLNQSGFGPFYSSMLTRAYLGASNETRPVSGTSSWVVEGDDLALQLYRPDLAGGPLHLLNVTVNETAGGASQLLQQDRKGMVLALGPAGMSLGVRHHALWEQRGVSLSPLESSQGHQVFVSPGKDPVIHPEALSLGRWMGISGAAVCPGMGSRTNLGQALLLGIFNIRLGHWWDSGTGSGYLLERQLPVVCYLEQEFLGRFLGTNGHGWYLTDGGHFENTGAYELIRRRTPLILVSDAGQDVEYRFGDLANLVERVRMDFGAEVEFLDEAALRHFFGGQDPGELGLAGLEALQARGPGDARFGESCAALALVRYPETAGASVLVLVKPSLWKSLPLDVLAYAQSREQFPQESTGDQFFSEPQWEGYRKLGETIGLRLFNRGFDLYLKTGIGC